jgi:hypothetical protein
MEMQNGNQDISELFRQTEKIWPTRELDVDLKEPDHSGHCFGDHSLYLMIVRCAHTIKQQEQGSKIMSG